MNPRAAMPSGEDVVRALARSKHWLSPDQSHRSIRGIFYTDRYLGRAYNVVLQRHDMLAARAEPWTSRRRCQTTLLIASHVELVVLRSIYLFGGASLSGSSREAPEECGNGR